MSDIVLKLQFSCISQAGGCVFVSLRDAQLKRGVGVRELGCRFSVILRWGGISMSFSPSLLTVGETNHPHHPVGNAVAGGF